MQSRWTSSGVNNARKVIQCNAQKVIHPEGAQRRWGGTGVQRRRRVDDRTDDLAMAAAGSGAVGQVVALPLRRRVR